jgi:hypothetical protein
MVTFNSYKNYPGAYVLSSNISAFYDFVVIILFVIVLQKRSRYEKKVIAK